MLRVGAAATAVRLAAASTAARAASAAAQRVPLTASPPPPETIFDATSHGGFVRAVTAMGVASSSGLFFIGDTAARFMTYEDSGAPTWMRITAAAVFAILGTTTIAGSMLFARRFVASLALSPDRRLLAISTHKLLGGTKTVIVPIGYLTVGQLATEASLAAAPAGARGGGLGSATQRHSFNAPVTAASGGRPSTWVPIRVKGMRTHYIADVSRGTVLDEAAFRQLASRR